MLLGIMYCIIYVLNLISITILSNTTIIYANALITHTNNMISYQVKVEELGLRYQTYCDPRLNGNQALEISFLIAERMRVAQGLAPLFTCV